MLVSIFWVAVGDGRYILGSGGWCWVYVGWWWVVMGLFWVIMCGRGFILGEGG